jgi:hypothetical protein
MNEEDPVAFGQVCGLGRCRKAVDPGKTYLSFTTVFWLSLMLIFSS